jgi:serine/threonine-protein kinase/endoribonuclease IRE1
VKACIDADPSKRPSATEILAHPMWWDAEKKLQFLIDASDRVELEDRMSDRSLLRAFETRAKSSIACDDWTKKLDAALLENLGRYREYDGTSLRDLLRVIRNKANHYRELPPKLQRTLGSYPDGLWRYVSIRFPALLLGVRDFFAPSAAREPTLAKYFLSIEAASKASFAPPLARAESIPDKPLIAPQVFPSRPGREPCEFYMKTGRCKFGATCKFDHPQGVHWDVHNER